MPLELELEEVELLDVVLEDVDELLELLDEELLELEEELLELEEELLADDEGVGSSPPHAAKLPASTTMQQ